MEGVGSGARERQQPQLRELDQHQQQHLGDFYDDPHQGPAEGLQVQAGDQTHVSEQVESGKLSILIDELLGLLCQDGIKQTGTGWGLAGGLLHPLPAGLPQVHVHGGVSTSF